MITQALSALFLIASTVCLAGQSAGSQGTAAKLPPPYATPSADNGPKVIGRPNTAKLQLPQGFHIEDYATGFETPRFMLLGPSQELLVSDSSSPGKVYVLTGSGKNRKALIEGLDRPYGLAFWKEYLYVGEPTSVKRYKYDSKAMTVQAPGQEVVKLQGMGRGHWTRSLLFDRKGEKLYVGVGRARTCRRVSPMSAPRSTATTRTAAGTRSSPPGRAIRSDCTGIPAPIRCGRRSRSGMCWATIWCRITSRTSSRAAFYGWPYAYAGPNEDPRNKGKRADLVQKTMAGDVLLTVARRRSRLHVLHAARCFRRNTRAGHSWRYHGSWNRSKRIGYSGRVRAFQEW